VLPVTKRQCDSGQEVSQSTCQTARNSSPNYFQIIDMQCRYNVKVRRFSAIKLEPPINSENQAHYGRDVCGNISVFYIQNQHLTLRNVTFRVYDLKMSPF
jgi:hypothetical protein